MGCGASNAAAVGGAPREGTSNVLLLCPAEWLAGLRLLPAAHEAVMKWCDEQGIGEMGDLKHAHNVAILSSSSTRAVAFAELQQAKLKEALSSLAAAIHADRGTWPAWGVDGHVDIGAPPPAVSHAAAEELRSTEPAVPPPAAPTVAPTKKAYGPNHTAVAASGVQPQAPQREPKAEGDAVSMSPEPEPELDVGTIESMPEPEPKPVAALERASSGPPFPNLGISLAGLESFLSTHAAAIGEGATTSEVCHTVIKLLTTPRGWICEATVTDAQKGWYRHRYVHEESGAASERPPPGTCSYLQLMQRAPGTAAFVGAPTVFLSHAWTCRFRNIVAALRSYVEALPAGSPAPFFWFDCLSIDEHATQTMPQEWWSTTFHDAIRGIGRTLMALSPWNDPVPLTRAWCLWELYSTDKVGADFRVCLGPDERRAFEAALVEDPGVIFEAFAHINVKNAQAGSAEDQAMILRAVERSVGFDGLNGLAFARMRAWVVGVARGRLQRKGTGIGDRNQIGELFRTFGMHAEALEVHEGTLARPDAEADDTAVAATLHNMAVVRRALGERQAALELYERALAIFEKAYGPNHTSVAATLHNMAVVRNVLGERQAALELYARALAIQEKAYGPNHTSVAETLNSMAIVRNALGERQAALELYARALAIREKTYGAADERTAALRAQVRDVTLSMQMPEEERQRWQRLCHRSQEEQARVVGLSDEDRRREREAHIQYVGLCWGDEATTVFLSACSPGPLTGSGFNKHGPFAVAGTWEGTDVSLVVTNAFGSFELRMQWSNAEESESSGGALRGIAQGNEDEVILHVVKA
eukprot:COSAG01_NODE_3171_length_6469_cov_9.978022_4_plen_817_part_00